MSLLKSLFLVLIFATLAGADPIGNQVEKYRPVILEAWKIRIAKNQGVHVWSNRNDGMRVFQEWIALLTSVREGSPELRRQTGMELEKYVVGDNIGPLGFIGTSLPVPGYDQGDFDMSLLGCSSLLGLFLEDRLLLTDATLIHLLEKVIRTWGQTPKAHFDVLFVSIPETENHLFMSESTRYLTNQILWENARKLPELQTLRDSLVHAGIVIDNDQGMLKRLLLKVMQQAMCKGFFEFNAQIYQRFTIHALDNLHSFAHDSSITVGAACLLDYLSTVFAFQSDNALRYGPFRRSSEVYQDSTLIANDAACSFFAIQSGAFTWSVDPEHGLWQTHTAHASMALYSSVLKYRIPDPILAYMQVRTSEYRAEIRSAYAGDGSRNGPTEVYYGAPNFLISAGGRHESYAGPNFPTYHYWFTDAPWVYDLITRSSSLLLAPQREKPFNLLDILHFKGSQWRANNMAIHRNFLYGYTAVDTYNSPAWPQHIPAQWNREGNAFRSYVAGDFEFRFVDRSRSGVYIVLSRLRQPKTILHWGYQKYLRGTIEVVDTAKVKSLSSLRDSVLALNSSKHHWHLGSRRFVYVNFEGERIQLNSRYDGTKRGILRIVEKARSSELSLPSFTLPFDFPWLGEETVSKVPGIKVEPRSKRASVQSPQFQVDLLTPIKGRAVLSDGQGNMYVFNPETGRFLLVNFKEWWNPRRLLGEPGLVDTANSALATPDVTSKDVASPASESGLP
jgi:hypothetical protein